jgi:tRNA modification GTPase
MYPLDDTIAAIASPPGGAARGIVRLSGPAALHCIANCFQPHVPLATFPHAVAGALRLPELNAPLPCDVYLWPGVRSYTGQPVAEIHTIGSPPLLELLLRALCASGARLAGPGEFTLRAFLAGRIDLTQAEAVLGVIDAADPHEFTAALAQLAGGLAAPLSQLREALLDLLAHLEAGLDFADDDLPFITCDELDRQLADTASRVAAIAQQMASRGETAAVARVALVGRPNTGKSSLFNALIGKQGALVSDRPGTTRDYLVAELDLDGVKCQLIDTAGTNAACPNPPGPQSRGVDDGDSSSKSDSRGIDLAAQSAATQQRRAAHAQVLCIDSTRATDDWERGELGQAADSRRIVALTKCDTPRRTDCTHPALETSSLTGAGVDALRRALRRTVLAAGGDGHDVVAATASRCAASLQLAGECLQRARGIVFTGGDELIAAEVRVALDELGKVVGAVYTGDVLDRIFSRFCIGK